MIYENLIDKKYSYIHFPTSFDLLSSLPILTFPVVILYGGVDLKECGAGGCRGEWFLRRSTIPKDLLEKIIFLLPKEFSMDNPDSDLKKCLIEFKSVTNIDPATFWSISLCAFSGGAHRLYHHANDMNWKIIGLIDPSAPTLKGGRNDVLDGCIRKVRCAYQPDNWGTGGKQELTAFTKHLVGRKEDPLGVCPKENADIIEYKGKGHLDMAEKFFMKFGGQLLW